MSHKFTLMSFPSIRFQQETCLIQEELLHVVFNVSLQRSWSCWMDSHYFHWWTIFCCTSSQLALNLLPLVYVFTHVLSCVVTSVYWVCVYVRRVDGDEPKETGSLRSSTSDDRGICVAGSMTLDHDVIMRAWGTAPRHSPFQLSILVYTLSVLFNPHWVFHLCVCQTQTSRVLFISLSSWHRAVTHCCDLMRAVSVLKTTCSCFCFLKASMTLQVTEGTGRAFLFAPSLRQCVTSLGLKIKRRGITTFVPLLTLSAQREKFLQLAPSCES